MTASRLEESVVATNVAARNDTGATDQCSSDIGNDGTVQVGHDLIDKASALASARLAEAH